MDLKRILIFIQNFLILVTLTTGNTCSASGNCDTENLVSTSSLLELLGDSQFTKDANGSIQFSTHINVTKSTVECASLSDVTDLTPLEILQKLTLLCRYDRFTIPPTDNGDPVTVLVRLNLEVLQTSNSNYPQLEATGVLQFLYTDARLSFEKISPHRVLNIIGEEGLDKLIWTPRVYFANAQREIPLAITEKLMLTNVSPTGSVVLTKSIEAKLDCNLNLWKFPFDDQVCNTTMESWLYSSTQLKLLWDKKDALKIAQQSGLMEFELENYIYSDVAEDSNLANTLIYNLQQNEEYTVLKFDIFLTRQSGYYILQYFIPSMMLVAISWVSFWLQPDQTPARTTLGTTTMLSFITLGTSQEKSLPKVNYIKLSEIWFFACNAFIFCSLVEFAFVNTIWRRKNNVTLKRINSTNILKNTLTPRNNRQLPKKLRKVNSVSSGISEQERFSYTGRNELEVPEINAPDSSYSSLSVDENPFNFRIDVNAANNVNNEDTGKRTVPLSSMTPQQVALWIDRKARFAFPLAFILFNAVFWTVINLS